MIIVPFVDIKHYQNNIGTFKLNIDGRIVLIFKWLNLTE